MEKAIQSLYFDNSCRKDKFNSIDTCYLFTNENMSGYMESLENKEVLSVAGSGDFYFNALLYGATSVDLFDINYLTKFLVCLKRCAIEQMDYDTFLSFLGLNCMDEIFSYASFRKICSCFDEELYTFWTDIYDLAYHDGYAIYTSNLITNFGCSKREIIEANPYLIKENYNRLKQILLETEPISFLHTDINELHEKITKKYDVMYFSNINIYQRNTTYLKQIKRLSQFVKEGGLLYFAYLHNYPYPLQSQFYDALLKSKKYTAKCLLGKSTSRKDKIYIYKKQ